MAIYALDDRVPEVGEGVWVADNARVIGKVSLSKQVSIWFNAILHADDGIPLTPDLPSLSRRQKNDCKSKHL